MNPWLLAALVFGGIGLLMEFVERKEDQTAEQIAADKKAAAAKKAAKQKAKPVVTETHPQPSVVVNLPSEKPTEVLPAKPSAKVPTETPTKE